MNPSFQEVDFWIVLVLAGIASFAEAEEVRFLVARVPRCGNDHRSNFIF